ncbi:hypothetical protein C8R47DRAFT_769045 [Mycena vitilis]|nr:hypothetical protein C8R47DRAFT_769045 [Mycena vitilis]
MAPRKITPALSDFIETTGQAMFTYTRAMEIHIHALQQDLNAAATAHAEYATRNPPSLGFNPSAEEKGRFRIAAEEMVNKKCATSVDHLEAVNAALFLIRCLRDDANNQATGRDWVLDEVLKKSTALEDANPFTRAPEDAILKIPAHPNSALRALLDAPVVPEEDNSLNGIVRHPDVIRCSPFKAPVGPHTTSSINRLLIAKWKKHPGQLYGKHFICENEGDEDIWWLDSFVDFSESGKIFYVQLADDEDGLAFPESDFFGLLAESKLIKL